MLLPRLKANSFRCCGTSPPYWGLRDYGYTGQIGGEASLDEYIFPVPVVIGAKPFLLGYYRLLFGISQKEFYSKGPFGRFKCLEVSGDIPERLRSELDAFCRSLIRTAEKLVHGLDQLSPAIIHDLQLLTLGPQFRGSENTRIGQQATKEVYSLIESITGRHIEDKTDKTIVVRNASDRMVSIEFFADPDIRIYAERRVEQARAFVVATNDGPGHLQATASLRRCDRALRAAQVCV